MQEKIDEDLEEGFEIEDGDDGDQETDFKVEQMVQSPTAGGTQSALGFEATGGGIIGQEVGEGNGEKKGLMENFGAFFTQKSVVEQEDDRQSGMYAEMERINQLFVPVERGTSTKNSPQKTSGGLASPKREKESEFIGVT